MKELLKNILREESVQYITENYSSLRMLANASEQELKQIPYVGSTKAKELKNIFQIGKSLMEPDTNTKAINSPQEAYELLRIMAIYEEERVCIIMLDTKNKLIDTALISKGSLNCSFIHPREIFTPAVRMKAAGIILAHNHPSQDFQESQDDMETTNRIKNAGEILGIPLLDHLIITINGFTSFKQKGLI